MLNVSAAWRAATSRARLVLLAFGWRGLIRRGWYEARLRGGWFRLRMPVRESFDASPSAAWNFRIDPNEIRERYDAAGILLEVAEAAAASAERLLGGQWRLFGGVVVATGWPPRWDRHPLTDVVYPAVHWSLIPDDDVARGDIKDVWELSRFGCTFVLARAFVLTGDSRYAAAWWSAVEDWAAHNPPNRGVNWRCAQEASLRAIAWCFGWSVFADDPSCTSRRVRLLGRMLGETVRRVRPTLGYALSQRNNHALSELALLLSFPGRRDRRAERWLREALADQFLPDGSYGQQSLVYQRLAVHVLTWLLATGERLTPNLREEVRRCLGASAAFLERCADPVTGQLMNYGANDGTVLLAIGDDDPLDARPTLAMLRRDRRPGPPPELSLWMTVEVGEASVADSTYVTMRGARSALLTRIGSIPRRPGDADQQAIELFIDGEHVVLDPGTYRYTAPGPWRNPFVSASVHSTTTSIDNVPSVAVGRFLRAPIASAELVARRAHGDQEVVVSRRRDGDVELVRTILRIGDQYAVTDVVAGGSGRVRWNLSPVELDTFADGTLGSRRQVNVAIDGGAGVRVVDRQDDVPGSGWWSPTYGVLEPCVVVEVDLTPGSVAMARFAPTDEALLTRDEALNRLTTLGTS